MKVKNSLDEILYEHIVESLINGDYEMGQNLTLDELAHRFEVSRTPVVQAVKLLANDGILLFPRTISRRGCCGHPHHTGCWLDRIFDKAYLM